MKPVVTYRGTVGPILVGSRAFLRNLRGHPSQLVGDMIGEVVQTSPVVRYDPLTEEIETANTIYQRGETDGQD